MADQAISKTCFHLSLSNRQVIFLKEKEACDCPQKGDKLQLSIRNITDELQYTISPWYSENNNGVSENNMPEWPCIR